MNRCLNLDCDLFFDNCAALAVGSGVVLAEGIQLVAVYRCTGQLSLCYAPGQHCTTGPWQQLQLGLLGG